MIGWRKKRCNELVKDYAEIVSTIEVVKTQRGYGTEPRINNKGTSSWPKNKNQEETFWPVKQDMDIQIREL